MLLAVLVATGRLNRFIYRPVDMENYWVTIPAGEFQMGSESNNDNDKNAIPVHKVYLDTYQIGKYEVTNKQYNQCRRANICTGSILPDKLDHPVANVSWYDAKTYCEWVGGRLPTEAEWEKAASWDDQRKAKRIFPWGESIDCTHANYMHGGNPASAGDDFCVGDTTPVGSYESGKSPYGLYDMAGTVWEWVNDWYSATYYQNSPSSNPPGPETGEFRVLRGGPWNGDPSFARSTDRFRISPALANNSWGFRCARSP
jgi:formylglycine-generating enzyme required for sulfatase activity